MIWVLVTVAAALTAAVLIWIGKVPSASRPLVGAAVMLGLAGYALQGSPSLAGKPVIRVNQTEGLGEEITDRQNGMQDRFGPATMWIAMSDGFMRTGKTELAAKALEKGLQKYPNDVDLWVGLGNALVAHGGGMMSPASALAFDQAVRLQPDHPAPPFFAGLALAQSGDFAGADRVWTNLLDRTPPGAGWEADLKMRLKQLHAAMGKENMPAEQMDGADMEPRGN
jgi:cytochrome c-type biogenesis protein CcmH